MKFFYFLFFIISISSVFAIGISPPDFDLNYEAGKTITLKQRIVNSNNPKTIHVTLNFTGALADYISTRENYFDIPPNSVKQLSYILRMPEGLEPGYHTTRVILTDIGDPEQKGMFKIQVAVAGKIRVFVPYPGLYSTTKLSISNQKEGNAVPYSVEITNKGKQTIDSGSLKIKFFKGDELIDVSSFDNVHLDSMETTTIEDYIPAGEFSKGSYHAESIFNYGGEEPSLSEKNFTIGHYGVSLINYSSYLYVSDITPLKFTLKSNWNDPISDTYVSLSLKDKEYRSIKENLKPFGEENYTIYVDDLSFVEGNLLNGVATIHYGKLNKTEILSFDVIKKPVKLIEEPTKTSKISPLVYANIGLILIVTILVLIVLLRKPIKKKKK